MPSSPKFLLIDANNMCHRCFWAQQELSYKGKQTNVVFGFFKQLVHLHKEYPDHFRIIAWDGGYARRLEESKKGVEAGIIPSEYKASRHNQEIDDEKKALLESLYEQMREVESSLPLIRCLQVRKEGYEADDIINTYVQTYRKWNSHCVIVSTDRDFFQLLAPGIVIYDGVKKEVVTEERFKMETGFSPSLWVDAGAIMGEVGPSKDNIFGVEGWGPVNASKYIREYGDIDAIIVALQAKSKRGKREDVFLNSIPRLRLAKSLKRMDMIPDVPKPRILTALDPKKVEQYFIQWGMVSLLKEIWRLV